MLFIFNLILHIVLGGGREEDDDDELMHSPFDTGMVLQVQIQGAGGQSALPFKNFFGLWLNMIM